MILWNFIKTLYLTIKYNKMINKIYEDEKLLNNLSMLFNAKFKRDWIGRVYAVLNPLISGGDVQINTQILEYGANGITDVSWVNKWVMDNMMIVSKFIRTNNLFDILTYDIKKLDDYNYLFVIEPIINIDMKKSLKKFTIVYGSIIIIAVILLIIFL